MSPRLPLPRRVTSLLSTVRIQSLPIHFDMSYPFESDSDPYRLLLSVSIPFNPSQCDYACRGESFPGQLRLYEPDWSRLILGPSVLSRLVKTSPFPSVDRSDPVMSLHCDESPHFGSARSDESTQFDPVHFRLVASGLCHFTSTSRTCPLPFHVDWPSRCGDTSFQIAFCPDTASHVTVSAGQF
jgi:hypothetical protein